MTDSSEPGNEVRIFAPDKSLLAKIGVANLDEIFTPRAITGAQEVIAYSADSFIVETLADLGELETFFQAINKISSGETQLLTPIIAAAFSIKAKSGLAGYDLVSALAKSLHLYCEALNDQPIVRKTCEVIEWHIMSIRQMLKLNIKGTGGAMGAAIMTELDRLAALTTE